jgi:hypothetical protein
MIIFAYIPGYAAAGISIQRSITCIYSKADLACGGERAGNNAPKVDANSTRQMKEEKKESEHCEQRYLFISLPFPFSAARAEQVSLRGSDNFLSTFAIDFIASYGPSLIERSPPAILNWVNDYLLSV